MRTRTEDHCRRHTNGGRVSPVSHQDLIDPREGAIVVYQRGEEGFQGLKAVNEIALIQTPASTGTAGGTGGLGITESAVGETKTRRFGVALSPARR